MPLESPQSCQSHLISAFLSFSSFSLLSPPLLHGQDLHHTDEDVDEVELEGDGFVHGVASEHAAFGHTCVGQDLLGVVESETAKDGQSIENVSVLQLRTLVCLLELTLRKARCSQSTSTPLWPSQAAQVVRDRTKQQ